MLALVLELTIDLGFSPLNLNKIMMAKTSMYLFNYCKLQTLALIIKKRFIHQKTNLDKFIKQFSDKLHFWAYTYLCVSIYLLTEERELVL